MGAKKAKKKRKKKKKASSKARPATEKRNTVQKQIYLSQELADEIDELRAEREEVLGRKYGHSALSWSRYVGSVLHDHVRRRKKA